MQMQMHPSLPSPAHSNYYDYYYYYYCYSFLIKCKLNEGVMEASGDERRREDEGGCDDETRRVEKSRVDLIRFEL